MIWRVRGLGSAMGNVSRGRIAWGCCCRLCKGVEKVKVEGGHGMDDVGVIWGEREKKT